MVTEDLSLNSDYIDRENENKQKTSNIGSTRVAQSSSGLPSSQGSGRFTNLQKYISANPNGGDQFSEKLSNSTSRDLNTFNEGYNKQSENINTGLLNAKSLFDTEGEGFKSKLSGYQQGLSSLNNIIDRGTFDQTANDINAFTNDQNQFNKFQTLQNKQGFDESTFQKNKQDLDKMYSDTLSSLDKKVKDIQSEKGRYNLLQQATPQYGQKATSGGNRLNQLFFQKDQNAVNNLQKAFENKAGQVKSKETDINNLGSNLQNTINLENSLANDLNTSAKNVQDTFYNKLNTQENIQRLNDERTNLYNDYIGQLQSGRINKELATMLGLQNIDTYDLTGQNSNLIPNNQFNSGNVIQKISPINVNQPNQNLITYNALKDPSQTGAYLQKGQSAQSFQDLLSNADYANYVALQKLTSNPDFMGKATGASQLNPAVSASVNNNLAETIKQQDSDFRNQYANKNYQALGTGTEVYSQPTVFGGTFSNSREALVGSVNEITDPNEIMNNYNAFKNQQTSKDKYTPYIASGLGYANIDDYIKTGNVNQNIDALNAGGSSQENMNKALSRAEQNSVGQLKNFLDNIINQTGVKNQATLTDVNTIEQNETYKKLKALGLL